MEPRVDGGEVPAEGVGGALRLGADDVPSFVNEVLMDPGRELPVVAVTTRFGGTAPTDADVLARELAGSAQVVLLETGTATWALTHSLPPWLDVYGGAARIWWPGLAPGSDPKDHPLLFTRNPVQAEQLPARIGRLLGLERAAAPPSAARGPVEQARVEAIRGRNILLEVAGAPGRLVASELGFDLLSEWLRPGQTLPVRAVEGRDAGGRQHWSSQGLLQAAWPRLASLVEAGDCVLGIVRRVTDRGVHVEVLPTVSGFVPIGEVDWTFVRDPREFVEEGQEVHVQVLEVVPESRRLILSIKSAMGRSPLERLELVPGGRAFPPRAEGGGEPETVAPAELEALREASEELSAQLADSEADRRRLAAEASRLQAHAAELRRELRAEQDRRAHLERAGGDPLHSERDFLTAVRVAYARSCDEEDRERFPLARMRVGKRFLESLRGLDGISVDKVVEVCAQVACGRAQEIAGREVHRLRSGSRGAAHVERPSDGASAWRCSLQDSTASARRLHWWQIPGPTGKTIELAQVGLHDDFSIPE